MTTMGRLLPRELLTLHGETLPFKHAVEMSRMLFLIFVGVSIVGLLLIAPFIASNTPGTLIVFSLLGAVAWLARRQAFHDPVRAMHLFGFAIALVAMVPLLLLGRQIAIAAVVIFSFIPAYAAVCGLLPAVVYVLGFVAVTVTYLQLISAGYALPVLFPLLLPVQVAVVTVCAFAIILPLPALFRSMAEERRRAEAELQMRVRREHELEIANAEATAANQRLLDFSHSASDGFWETDSDNRLTYVSRQEARSGTPGHLAIGDHPWAPAVLLADHDAPEWLDARSLFESHTPFRDLHLPYTCPDGTSGWLSVSGIPRHDEQGRFLGFRGVTTDVSERKRAEMELLAAREAAETANRAKSDFLTNMSHELRTPMNAIMGLTQLALESDLSPRQADYIRTVHSSANVLLQLINDILDLSKIEAGRLQIAAERFDVRQILEEVRALFHYALLEKDLALVMTVAPQVPGYLIGDDLRIRQILVNLLGNSLKFTERGGITIQVSGDPPVAGKMCLRFAVIDSGIGIAAEQIERLFTPFSQGDESISRRFGGSGLGLSISRRLVEAMGGEISIQSELGQGSNFTFTVMVQTLDALATVPASAALAPDETIGKKSALGTWRESDVKLLGPQIAELDDLLARNLLEARDLGTEILGILDGPAAQAFARVQQATEALKFREARIALAELVISTVKHPEEKEST